MKKSGFTFVEIAIVVAIIGMLAAMGVLAISKGVNNSKTRQAEGELEMLSAAVLQLAWDTGRWPNGEPRNDGGSAEVWDLSGDSSGLLGNDGTYNNWQGPYCDADALKDPWYKDTADGRHRLYFFDPDYNHQLEGVIVTVGSFGPNGKGPNLYDSDDVLPEVPDLGN